MTGYIAEKGNPHGVREGKGTYDYQHERLTIRAPKDYLFGDVYTDNFSTVGYMHSFLKPFQSLMFGRWKHKKGVITYRQLFSVVYIMIETTNRDGLRCAGSIALAKGKWGYTLAFFPVLQRLKIQEREVDHLTAHFTLNTGRIQLDSVHAKCRESQEKYPRLELPLDHLQYDDYHFAFEYWVKQADFCDPCGSVSGMMKSLCPSPGDDKGLKTCLRNSSLDTMACGTPTQTGTVNPSDPLCVRIGVFTEDGKKLKGGVEKVLGDPRASRIGTIGIQNGAMRTHHYRNISLIESQWPSDMTVFVDIAVLDDYPQNDFNLPDLRGTTFTSSPGIANK